MSPIPGHYLPAIEIGVKNDRNASLPCLKYGLISGKAVPKKSE